jgi:hypothetical protein
MPPLNFKHSSRWLKHVYSVLLKANWIISSIIAFKYIKNLKWLKMLFWSLTHSNSVNWILSNKHFFSTNNDCAFVLSFTSVIFFLSSYIDDLSRRCRKSIKNTNEIISNGKVIKGPFPNFYMCLFLVDFCYGIKLWDLSLMIFMMLP